MNDTEIVDQLMKWMKPYVNGNHPAPPISIGYALTWIAIQRGDQRKARRKVTYIIHDPKNHDYDEHCTCGPCDKVRSHKTKEVIKPQAERDDWWTARIDPYDDRIRTLERWMHQTRPRHVGSCSNFNAIDPEGEYKGVEECGCNKLESWRRVDTKEVLGKKQEPDVGKHKHAWFDNTAAGAQKCGWYGCDAVRDPGGFVYRTMKDYQDGGPYATDTAEGGFKLIGDAVAAKDADPVGKCIDKGRPHSEWCDVLTTSYAGCNCPAGNPKEATPATSTRAHVEPCRLETDHKGPCGIPSVPIRTAGGPYQNAADVQWGEREKRMASDILNRAFDAPKLHQAFWRCRHYPSAIRNWWSANQCEWGCHNHSPTWDSNGDSK